MKITNIPAMFASLRMGYKLKQVPQAWYSRLSSKLYELDFILSKADTSLFIFNEVGVTIYMLIYVDGIIIARSCNKTTDKLLQQLAVDLSIKNLGKLSYFLGV